jgi:3-dehydroquinate synthetase
MDTATLATLPSAEFRSGLAEIVKHGIIGAPALFTQLEQAGPASLLQLVADAVRVKIDVVEEDPFEQGRRATLNLGHTFGHALELVSEYTLRHGEAVAIGLVAAANLAVALGRCDSALAERITHLLDRLGLPIRAPGYDVDAVLHAMGHDKKRAGKRLRFVIPQALGDVVVIDDPGADHIRGAIWSVVL